MLSVIVASCLKEQVEEREKCLIKTLENYKYYLDKDFNYEIILVFDKTNKQDVSKKILELSDSVFFQNDGLGSSFQIGLEQAKFDTVLQTEDDWVFDTDQYCTIEESIHRFKTGYYIVNEYDQNSYVRLDMIPQVNWRLGFETIKKDNLNFYKLNRPDKEKTNFFNPYDFYFYCNRPHFKNKNFHKKHNVPYRTQCKVHEVEIDMCEKFLQNEAITVYSTDRIYNHTGSKCSVREKF